MNEPVIYIATNLINGKIYIGQTMHLKRRITEHKCYSRPKSRKEKSAFHDAIKKYGFENFKFEILEMCDKEMLDERERYWIAFKKSNDKKIGYNITEGGDKGPTYIGCDSNKSVLSEEQVKFIRENYSKLISKKDTLILFKENFFDINNNTFNDVWHGKTYRNILPEVYTDDNRKKQKELSIYGRPKKQITTVDDIVDIRNRKNNGEIVSDVVERYKGKVGEHTVKDIWYYRVYPEILPTVESHYRKNAKREKGDVYLKKDLKTGEVIKEYQSLREAVIELMGEYKKIYACGIRHCCKHINGQKSYKGYKWEFKNTKDNDKD